MRDGRQFLNELIMWELPESLRKLTPVISYDGQVYHRCSECGKEVRTSAGFADATHEMEWRCRGCGITPHLLTLHLANCECQCQDCGEEFMFPASGLDNVACPRCTSTRLTVFSAEIDPPFPAECEEGYGWPEVMTPPEKMHEVLNRERHVWGSSVNADISELMWQLQFYNSMPELPSTLRREARFCRRMWMFDAYGNERSSAFIMDFEGGLLHDCFRYTADPAAGIESIALCERSNAALSEDPFNLALGEHNFAMRVYSVLREFGDAQFTLMSGRPGLRLEALAAAERSLAFFRTGSGRSAEGAPAQVARIQWLLGDLLSLAAGAGSILENARSAFPALSQHLGELENTGLWDAGSENPSREQLERAVTYLSAALDSGQLREDWAFAARQSRVAAIMDMKDAPAALRQQAISDLTAAAASLEEADQPQAWITLESLATLYLDEGSPERALSALERACSRAIVDRDRAYDESTLHIYAERYCRLFDTLARTYAELNRPVEALCALEILRGSTIRIHTMTEDERSAAAKAREQQRTRDAVRYAIQRLGETVSTPQVRPISDVLAATWEQITKGILPFPGSTYGFVSMSLWRDSVVAVIAKPDARNGLVVRSRIWTAPVDQLALTKALTPPEPSTWRERRLQALCDLAYRDLWHPLGETLRELEITDVIISAPGLLSGLPFEAVVLPATEAAAARPNLVYLPSLRLAVDLAAAQSRGKEGLAARILAIKYQGPDLPQAAREIEMLQEIWGDKLKVLDTSEIGKRDLLRELSGGWDIIHFACHGTFDEMDPWNSALHLTSDPERDDQRLSAHDLLSVRLENSPVVILSACSTALTSSSAVNDAAGLIGGFLRGGAKGIIAAQWPVYDETAFTFMAHLHSAVRDGVLPSSAVYDAQERLRANYGIEDWAAFGYTGLPE